MSSGENRLNKIVSAVVVVCFVALQLAVPATSIAAAKDDLKRIEYKLYFRGNYDKAITELRAFLEREDVTPAEIMEAKEYLAASLIMTGAATEGRSQFLDILKMDGKYQGPDPSVFKSVVISTYDEAKSQYASSVIRNVPPSVTEGVQATTTGAVEMTESKPLYKKWWFYATMGAVVVALAAAAGGGSKGEDAPSDTGGVTIGVEVR